MVSNCFHFTYSYWAVEVGIGIRQHEKVRNELVSICDELKRQGVLDTKAYKKLNSIIKK